jgi:hypothetical protein
MKRPTRKPITAINVIQNRASCRLRQTVAEDQWAWPSEVCCEKDVLPTLQQQQFMCLTLWPLSSPVPVGCLPFGRSLFSGVRQVNTHCQERLHRQLARPGRAFQLQPANAAFLRIPRSVQRASEPACPRTSPALAATASMLTTVPR